MAETLAEKNERSRKLREQILALKAQGLSYPQIGDKLDVSRCVVAGHVRRHNRGEQAGVQAPRGEAFTAKEDRKIMDGVSARKPCRQIAQELKRSYDAVRKRGNRLGVTWDYPKAAWNAGQKVVVMNEDQERSAWQKGDRALIRAIAQAIIRGENQVSR